MEEAIAEIANSNIIKDQFAKVILGAISGFAASKLSEKVYDKAIAAYRIKKAASSQ